MKWQVSRKLLSVPHVSRSAVGRDSPGSCPAKGPRELGCCCAVFRGMHQSVMGHQSLHVLTAHSVRWDCSWASCSSPSSGSTTSRPSWCSSSPFSTTVRCPGPATCALCLRALGVPEGCCPRKSTEVHARALPCCQARRCCPLLCCPLGDRGLGPGEMGPDLCLLLGGLVQALS